jgi:hypothetical protein
MSTDTELKVALFEEANELADPAQRRALLDARCAGDAALRKKIEKLLSAGERAEEFFSQCTFTPNTDSADRI